MAEPKRGSVEAFKAAEKRRQERIKKASTPKVSKRNEAFNKKVAAINKSRTDQGSVAKFKAAEERRQQRLAEVNKPKFGSPKMKKQRAQADVEKDLPKAKTTAGKVAGAAAAGAAGAATKTAAKTATKKDTSKPLASPTKALGTFAEAFKKARSQGAGTKFAYNDKMYSAVTKDDISSAGKSNLREYLNTLKRKDMKIAKAPGQKAMGGVMKKRRGGMASPFEREQMERMIRRQKEKATQRRQRMDLERMKEATEKRKRAPARPMPMDPNMQREAKPMPMTPGERPNATPYKSYYNKDTNSVIFSDAKNQNEIDSILNQMQKSPAEDRFKSGGSVMARGCKMGRKKATKLY